MRLPEVVSRQLSNPTGRVGRIVRGAMNRGNASMNEEAIDLLGIEPGHRILDIGFGGGVTFPLLLDRGAHVAGIDRSADVVAAAEEDHRQGIDAGRIGVRRGEVEDIPFEDEAFAGVLTVNTVYFWPDLGVGLSEIRRVLEPGGRVVIGIRDGSVMKRVSRDIFTIRTPAELLVAIEAAGFLDGRLESSPDGSRHLLSATTP